MPDLEKDNLSFQRRIIAIDLEDIESVKELFDDIYVFLEEIEPLIEGR